MADSDDLNLQDIIDAGAWGPEPNENYLEQLDALDNVVRECISVTKRYAGIRSLDGRHFYASVLFVAMITRGVSLLNLAPHSPWAVKKIEHWDYSSMTGIARTLLELRAAFHYLCTDPCSRDEWDCRWNLFNLHDCVSRVRLFDAQGVDEEVAVLKVQAEELRERLRKNPFFMSLDSKRHKKLLHGQTAYLFPLETLLDHAGIPVETFRWLYVLFSTHVHALPMSFYRIGREYPERGRGLPSSSEEGYSALCLSLAASLIVTTRDEVHGLFEGLRPDPAYKASQPTTEDLPTEAGPAELALGEPVYTDLSDEIRMVQKRISEDQIEVVYVHRQTGETVFEGTASDASGLQFDYIDPYFWQLSVNGEATSKCAVERMLDGEFLMRIDVAQRRVHFKAHARPEGE